MEGPLFSRVHVGRGAGMGRDHRGPGTCVPCAYGGAHATYALLRCLGPGVPWHGPADRLRSPTCLGRGGPTHCGRMECVSMRATDPHASYRVAPSVRIHHPPAVARVDAAASTYGISYRIR